MPNKNIVKIYDVDNYYHVYNRGIEKRQIFLDDQDYAVFINLLKRHLDSKPYTGSLGREYAWLSGQVEVVAFCLMPNHFHLLLFQNELNGVTRLMRAICSSYVTYFNEKYGRVGTLFQGKFKAKKAKNDEYLLHLTRYIHRNPNNFLNYEWSSLDYWLKNKNADWICPNRLNDMAIGEHLKFIADDNDYRLSNEKITYMKF